MDATVVTVLAASRYSFEDEKTGRLIEGTKVVYYPHDVEVEPDRLGYQVANAKLPYSDFAHFQSKAFPFDAEIDYAITIKAGNPTFKVKAFKEIG